MLRLARACRRRGLAEVELAIARDASGTGIRLAPNSGALGPARLLMRLLPIARGRSATGSSMPRSGRDGCCWTLRFIAMGIAMVGAGRVVRVFIARSNAENQGSVAKKCARANLATRLLKTPLPGAPDTLPEVTEKLGRREKACVRAREDLHNKVGTE